MGVMRVLQAMHHIVRFSLPNTDSFRAFPCEPCVESCGFRPHTPFVYEHLQKGNQGFIAHPPLGAGSFAASYQHHANEGKNNMPLSTRQRLVR